MAKKALGGWGVSVGLVTQASGKRLKICRQADLSKDGDRAVYGRLRFV